MAFAPPPGQRSEPYQPPNRVCPDTLPPDALVHDPDALRTFALATLPPGISFERTMRGVRALLSILKVGAPHAPRA